MAIIGIGTDITEIVRIEQAMARHPRWMARIFTDEEVTSVGGGRQRLVRLAGRFAAKEAVMKAAGGLHGSSWHDLEVLHRAGCAAAVVLHGPFKQWIVEQELTVHLSLSHEKSYAVAVAVLERLSHSKKSRQ